MNKKVWKELHQKMKEEAKKEREKKKQRAKKVKTEDGEEEKVVYDTANCVVVILLSSCRVCRDYCRRRNWTNCCERKKKSLAR